MVKKTSKQLALQKKNARDISFLKKMSPAQREVVSTSSTSAPPQLGAIKSMTNAALDDNKLLLRGIECRMNPYIGIGDATGGLVRYIIFLYKCDVDYTAPQNPVVSDPVPEDILDDIQNRKNTALQNPINSARIQVLYDTTCRLVPSQQFEDFKTYKVFFKVPKQMKAMKDKQRVLRPFILSYFSTATTVPVGLGQIITTNLHTTQIPE